MVGFDAVPSKLPGVPYAQVGRQVFRFPHNFRKNTAIYFNFRKNTAIFSISAKTQQFSQNTSKKYAKSMQKAREKYAIFISVNIAVFLRGGMPHSDAFQLGNSGYESHSPRALAPANITFCSSGADLGTLMGRPRDLVTRQLADPTYPDPTFVPPKKHPRLVIQQQVRLEIWLRLGTSWKTNSVLKTR